jgi:hypothetical protein
LIADGYHARTDGLTSLAVVAGAIGVWLGFPLADPIVGLLITAAILGIVWQSGRAVFTRMLDGVEPGITAEVRHAAEHVPGIRRVADLKTRWLGHRLHVDIAIELPETFTLAEAEATAGALRRELRGHLPALRSANVTFGEQDLGTAAGHAPAYHHAPEPFPFACTLAEGTVEIADTPRGERMRLVVARGAPGLAAKVSIARPGERSEVLQLVQIREGVFESKVAPEEPHEFAAELHLAAGENREAIGFRMTEPEEHAHHH